jgi:prepilin-type N-terminal cleavage/methylation domain-containing protein
VKLTYQKGDAGGGFSLVELLVTLAIILVLYTLTMSRGARSYQRRQQAACEKNLVNLHVALTLYANDHQGAFPLVPGARTSEEPLSLLVPTCTTTTAPFICPGSKDPKLPEAEPFAKRRISYAYYMGRTNAARPQEPLLSDRQVNTQAKRAGEPLFSTSGKKPGDNHTTYGGVVLFGDGHAELSGPAAGFDLLFGEGITLLNPKP